MNSSIRLFDLFGITLRVHVTFPLILIYGMIVFGLNTGLGWTGALFGVIVTLLLFGIVVLHEFGHSFAALYYDVPVDEIVLLPIGGVARIRDIPEDSVKEFVIAIAGPLVNFAIAGILYGVNATGLLPINFANPAALLSNLEAITIGNILGYLWYVNLFIAIFNLLPAFPMDGGRILRAGLGIFIDYDSATRVAASIGQLLAAGLGLIGFLNGNFFLIIIAIFIYLGANQEGSQVQLRQMLGDMTVADAYSRDVQILSPDDPLQRAIDITLQSFQQDFPVCDGERLVGLLPYKTLVQALDENAPDTPVRDVMQRDVKTAAPEDALFEIQKHMSENQIDAVPVVDDQNLVGLLTNRDIREVFRFVSKEKKALQKQKDIPQQRMTMD